MGPLHLHSNKYQTRALQHVRMTSTTDPKP
jgi:hypothetical protein